MAVVITSSNVLECESMLNCHDKLSSDHVSLTALNQAYYGPEMFVSSECFDSKQNSLCIWSL